MFFLSFQIVRGLHLMLFYGEKVVNELLVRDERMHQSLFSLCSLFSSPPPAPVFCEEVLKYIYPA